MAVVYKLFKTPGGNYLYDRSSNAILRLSLEVYNEFKQIDERGNLLDVNLFEKYRAFGFLKESVVEKIEHPSTDHLEYMLQNDLSGVILQVTQNCNFRCEYCIYSGSYNGRTHSNKRMSKDTAIKAIDFAVTHSNNKEILYIGFYGGEPLIETELIKACCKYAKEKYPNRNLFFHMTTNASYVKDHILDSLVENDVRLTVSLDGPIEVQDSKRKTISGDGTFNTVYNNLQEIASKYPNYFKSHVNYNCVVSPDVDFMAVNQFYNNDRLLKGRTVNLSQVSDEYSTEEIAYGDKFKTIYEFEYCLLLLHVLEKIDTDKVSDLFKGMLPSITSKLNMFTPLKNVISKVCHHSGPCTPGVTKLFVDVDGTLFPCEKLSEASAITRIGDIYNGYDLNNVSNIINIGKITEEECKNCWNFYTCDLCVAKADGITGLSREKKLRACERSKHNALLDMRMVCILKDLQKRKGAMVKDEKIGNL